MLALVLWWCAPCLLVALLLCLWCVACKYGSISHFKGVFRGFPLLDVGLYCSGALRGLYGFCTREVFGGLKACSVFAFVFPLLCPCFCPFVLPFVLAFVLLAFLFSLCSSCLLLVLLPCLSCFVFVVAFSLSDVQTKRKGAKSCPLRPLLSCCGLLLCVCHLFAGFLPYLFCFFGIQSATVPMLAARAIIDAI